MSEERLGYLITVSAILILNYLNSNWWSNRSDSSVFKIKQKANPTLLFSIIKPNTVRNKIRREWGTVQRQRYLVSVLSYWRQNISRNVISSVIVKIMCTFSHVYHQHSNLKIKALFQLIIWITYIQLRSKADPTSKSLEIYSYF